MSTPPAVAAAIRSPFVRLAELLGDTPPGMSPIALSVGEPQHAVPDFVGPVLAANLASFNKYPAVRGTDEFRASVAGWVARRYPGVVLDPAKHIVVLAGSREGLFYATLAAATYAPLAGRRYGVMPNPFYPPYVASARAARLDPLPLDAGADTGFLPDLDAVPAKVWDETATYILCTPANPQGAVASRAYLAKAIGLARRHGFLLFVDECYSEIYGERAPPGGLEVAAETGSLDNVVVFNSLSKRSNLAGLRVGFTAGDPALMQHMADYRNVSCPQVPVPLQAVAAAAYADEAHVEENRRLYRLKFEAAQRLLGNQFGPVTPEGGFFLWLDVTRFGGDEALAKRLWAEAGLRVVPGRYLASEGPAGNPGAGFLRVALVHDQAVTEEALTRLVRTLR